MGEWRHSCTVLSQCATRRTLWLGSERNEDGLKKFVFFSICSSMPPRVPVEQNSFYPLYLSIEQVLEKLIKRYYIFIVHKPIFVILPPVRYAPPAFCVSMYIYYLYHSSRVRLLLSRFSCLKLLLWPPLAILIQGFLLHFPNLDFLFPSCHPSLFVYWARLVG